MKTMYIDCQMGAAGDMLTGALLELIPDKKGIIDQMNAIGIPGVKYVVSSSQKCGITGTHVEVYVHGQVEDEHMHEHDNDEHHEHNHANENHGHTHSHGHSHVEEHHHEHSHHHHASLSDIEHIVRGHLTLPKKVADDVMAVYELIAQAESHAHGVPITDIHFHEVGTMDAIADITAVCLLMYILAPQNVVVSPIHVGRGQVKCAHGILPVPAPATAHILRNIPIYSGNIDGELCTPTGAALLKYFADEFGSMPAMITEEVGYGMGTKDFPAANCVRIMLGDLVPGVSNSGLVDREKLSTVTKLECNIDDMTGEELGFATEQILSAGALEAFSTACTMKKSRPGHVLTVLTNNEDVDKIVSVIFKYTTTIGIRKSVCERYTLDRTVNVLHTQYGDVRQKVSTGYGVVRSKCEYDDVAEVSRKSGLSYREVVDIISKHDN